MAVLVVVAVIAVAVILMQAQGGSGSLGGLLSFGKLSAAQIAPYAANAGFSGSDLTLSVAIALAESGGDPTAVGDLAIVKPNGSIGLWQINTNAHPEFDVNSLTDPQYNANAAFQIYSSAGNRFTPWSTYNNGLGADVIAAASAGVTEYQGGNG